MLPHFNEHMALQLPLVVTLRVAISKRARNIKPKPKNEIVYAKIFDRTKHPERR